MKITCTKPYMKKYRNQMKKKNEYITHYGRMLIQGEEYEISRVFKRKTQIITDYDNHWKYVGLIADSLKWLRLGYTPDNMREVIPEYITISEMERLTTKSVLIPFAEIITSYQQSTMDFCILSDKEVCDLGAVLNKKGNRKGEPSFCYSVHMIDDYFDYKKIRRDNILNNLLS